LFCSVKCPGNLIVKTYDLARELRDAGVVLVGGFHSPMERECLDLLLRGLQPVIYCPAKGLSRLRLAADVRRIVKDGQLLVLSPFGEEVRRTTSAQAMLRNEFIAALADAVFIPYASPNGKIEALCREIIAWKKPLYTLDDPQTQT